MDSGNGKAGSSSSEVKEIDEAQVNSAYELYEEVQEKEAAVKSINIKIDGNAERKAKVETTRKQLEDLKKLREPLLEKLAQLDAAAAANKQE